MFILFLVFILFLGNFIVPLMLNNLGYHCDTEGVVWRVEGLHLVTNLDLFRTKPDLSEDFTKNIPLICGGSGKREGSKVVICTNCPVNNETLRVSDQFCIGDGYRLTTYETFFEKLNCNWYGCKPPEGYYYNYTVDKYVCDSTFCINQTLTEYNNKIYEIESATPYFNVVNDTYDYRGLIYPKCAEDNPVNIRMTLWGIDILDYKLWVALMILGILIYFYTQFK
jgi:hypothetical protein